MLPVPNFKFRVLDVLPPEKRRLGGIFFLIILVHFGIFFLIRVQYPRQDEMSSRRATVSLLSEIAAGPEAYQRMTFWNALRDPSLLLVPPKLRVEEAHPFHPHFQSGSTSETITVGSGRDLDFLSGNWDDTAKRAEEAIKAPLLGFSYPEIIIPPLQAETRVVLGKRLQARFKGAMPTLPKARVSLLNEAGVTMLSVGLKPDGIERFVLVEESCGSVAVDAMAVDLFRKLPFSISESKKLEWGTATIYWVFESSEEKKQ